MVTGSVTLAKDNDHQPTTIVGDIGDHSATQNGPSSFMGVVEFGRD